MLDSDARLSYAISLCESHQTGLDLDLMLCEQELPSREAVRDVIAVADAFWAAHPGEYIAIHCAYGAPRLLARCFT